MRPITDNSGQVSHERDHYASFDRFLPARIEIKLNEPI
jgi:hypothetical protein